MCICFLTLYGKVNYCDYVYYAGDVNIHAIDLEYHKLGDNLNCD